MSNLDEARIILENLSSMPFAQCCVLSPNLLDVPTCPGLYAVRHREHGILYIGQTAKLRQRFKDGHKAFFLAFLDYYSPDDVRIAIEVLGFQSLGRAEDLETLMIRIVKPRYNSRIK
jgi:excinuclease UvrABC nuclease subunit